MQRQEQHFISLFLLSIFILFNTCTTTSRPLNQNSDQTITFYMTGTEPLPGSGTSSTGLFSPQTSIDQSTSFLTFLTNPEALEAGKLAIIDQELRGEGETGTLLIGQVNGVSVTSLVDNSSSILAIKASFTSIDGELKDSLRFFGVHSADLGESQISVIGGTGKYDEASGFAIIKPIQDGSLSNSFTFTVYL
ncbi:hypothetical protein LUZ60_011117 [Juncus effusus]|nr:hypothetical protein LUZ60_011117 [Juncus effusus]